jgi:hypothetical protein
MPAQTDVPFFSEGGIAVTKTRFMVTGQTFAMAGVTSVRAIEIRPKRSGPIILLIFGLLLAALLVGIPIVIAAIIWLCLQKPTFAVVLTTAGGEVTAHSTRDRGFIMRLVEALNQVIVARE